MSKQLVKASRFLSNILRHNPQDIGLAVDDYGWASIAELLEKARGHSGVDIDEALLHQVVETSEKKRFAISDDGLRIRANQGHSIKIKFDDLPEQEPPAALLHGTATRFLEAIMATGLSKMDRHHVHLSETANTAADVGRRYGKLVMLQIDAKAMHEQGHKFFRTENGVWLVDAVPVEFLKVIEPAQALDTEAAKPTQRKVKATDDGFTP